MTTSCSLTHPGAQFEHHNTWVHTLSVLTSSWTCEYTFHHMVTGSTFDVRANDCNLFCLHSVPTYWKQVWSVILVIWSCDVWRQKEVIYGWWLINTAGNSVRSDSSLLDKNVFFFFFTTDYIFFCSLFFRAYHNVLSFLNFLWSSPVVLSPTTKTEEIKCRFFL